MTAKNGCQSRVCRRGRCRRRATPHGRRSRRPHPRDRRRASRPARTPPPAPARPRGRSGRRRCPGPGAGCTGRIVATASKNDRGSTIAHSPKTTKNTAPRPATTRANRCAPPPAADRRSGQSPTTTTSIDRCASLGDLCRPQWIGCSPRVESQFAECWLSPGVVPWNGSHGSVATFRPGVLTACWWAAAAPAPPTTTDTQTACRHHPLDHVILPIVAPTRRRAAASPRRPLVASGARSVHETVRNVRRGVQPSDPPPGTNLLPQGVLPRPGCFAVRSAHPWTSGGGAMTCCIRRLASRSRGPRMQPERVWPARWATAVGSTAPVGPGLGSGAAQPRVRPPEGVDGRLWPPGGNDTMTDSALGHRRHHRRRIGQGLSYAETGRRQRERQDCSTAHGRPRLQHQGQCGPLREGERDHRSAHRTEPDGHQGLQGSDGARPADEVPPGWSGATLRHLRDLRNLADLEQHMQRSRPCGPALSRGRSWGPSLTTPNMRRRLDKLSTELRELNEAADRAAAVRRAARRSRTGPPPEPTSSARSANP